MGERGTVRGIQENPGPPAAMIACDVLIAGGGPAGSIAARVLATSGLRVVLADRTDSAKPKIGESLPGVALRLLRSLGPPTPNLERAHRRIRGNLSCWGSDQLEVTDFIRDPDGPAWRLDRKRFDSELLATCV